MGKQVNFFMLPEDEDQFVRWLRQRSEIIIIKGISYSNAPEAIEKLPDPLICGQVWIYNKKILGKVVMDFIQRQNYYSIDRWESTVVKFSRSELRDNTLIAGRLWAEMRTINMQYKGQEFEKWYDSLARWIRRNYKYIKEEYSYAGPKAYDWYIAGGKLSLNP